jgi:TRAP-type C4-dicarboxylate transport system permease small subunit
MALLPPKPKFAFRVVAEVLTIGFFVVMGWVGYQVLGVLDTDHLVSLPWVPVSWVQSVVPISAVLIVAAELVTLPAVLANALHPPAVTGGASH